MKVLFATARTEDPSTQLSERLLRGLGAVPGCSIDCYGTDYRGYDVIIFMGYDPDIPGARAVNPGARIGVLDPRPPAPKQPEGADFILANGIEMQDWYLRYTDNVFVYHLYPVLDGPRKQHHRQEPIVIGYHGNAVHLQAMAPRITTALERLAGMVPLEFWALYNREALGEWHSGLPDPARVPVRHIQWSWENYQRFLAQADIGIVPNLLPLHEPAALKQRGLSPGFPAGHDSDYLVRYKATSNAGRILVFAQLNIPVVADWYPSALQVIEHGRSGFVACSTEGWYRALVLLSGDPGLRDDMAGRLGRKFRQDCAPDVQNRRLVQFLQALPGAEKFSGR